MASQFTRLAASIALALALAGCPSDPPPTQDGGVDAGVTLSPVEMCERIAVARCNLIQRCYAGFADEPVADCKLLEQTRCLVTYTALKPSFEAGNVEIDVARVLACEERMATSACAPTFPPGYASSVASPFQDCEITTGLLTGKVPAGEPCNEAVECVDGTVCVKPGGVCTGTCSTYPLEGEPCGFGCAPGLYCDDKGTEATFDDRCAAPKGLNEPCTSSLECEPDLWCDGVCKQRGSAGDPCRFDPNRLSTCQPGLACDVLPYVDQEGTCITPHPISGPCWFHWSCAPGLVCHDLDLDEFPMATPPQPGTCDVPLGAGDPCFFTPYATFLGDTCLPGTTCGVENRCEIRPVLGEACNPETQPCAGQDVYCKPSETVANRGTCTGPAPLNQRCATRLDNGQIVQIPCESGWCDTDTTLNCLPPNKQIGQACASDGECLSGRCAVQEDRTLRCAEACL